MYSYVTEYDGYYYTDPVSSTASTSTNVKPNPIAALTAIERNLLENPPYHLSLSHEQLLGFKNKSRLSKPPPRPQNAWVLYRKNFEEFLRLQDPDVVYRLEDVSKEAGSQWRQEPTKVKEYFHALSKKAQEKHRLVYPDYVYNPKRRKTKRKAYMFKITKKEDYVKRKKTRTAAGKKTNSKSARWTQASGLNENTVGAVHVENNQLDVMPVENNQPDVVSAENNHQLDNNIIDNGYVNINDSSFFSYSLGPGYFPYYIIIPLNDVALIDTNEQSVTDWSDDNSSINNY